MNHPATTKETRTASFMGRQVLLETEEDGFPTEEALQECAAYMKANPEVPSLSPRGTRTAIMMTRYRGEIYIAFRVHETVARRHNGLAVAFPDNHGGQNFYVATRFVA